MPNREMRSRERSKSSAGGTGAARSGSPGESGVFQIEVRTPSEFQAIRNEAASADGVGRIEGRRESGEWETQAWLIDKRHAHVENGRLIADSEDARKVLDDLDSIPEQIEGDRFHAKPRRKVRAVTQALKAQAESRNKLPSKAAAKKAPWPSR